MEAFTVSETKIFSFGEAKKKHADYMDLRAQLKRQPLTDAERNVVDAAGGRYAGKSVARAKRKIKGFSQIRQMPWPFWADIFTKLLGLVTPPPPPG